MFDFLPSNIFLQIIQTLVIFIIAFILIRVFSKIFTKIIGEKTESRKQILRNLKRFFQIIIYLSCLLLVLWVFEVEITGLVTGLGVSALIIGFALKDFIENWVSGLLIISGRTYKLGDIIQVGDLRGVVTELSLRTTSLKTFDQNKIFIPNSVLLREKIVNSTDGQKESVSSIIFLIDYIFNIDKAKAIIESVLKNNPNVLVNEKRKREIRFSVKIKEWISEIEVFFWINNPKKEEFIKSEIVELVKKRFEDEKILPPLPSIMRRDYLESLK